MIEPGKWYVFKSQTDKMVFLQTLMHDYKDTLQEEPNVAFLMGKQALRITPHGHHIGYRTTVDSRYMSPIIFFSGGSFYEQQCMWMRKSQRSQ